MERRQLTWDQRGWLWFRLGIRLVLTAVTLVLLLRFGRRLLSLFAPFLAAAAAAAVLNRPVRWLQRKLGWSRQLVTLALLLVLVGTVGGAVGLLGYAAGQEVMALTRNWDGLLAAVRGVFDQLEDLLAQLLVLVPVQLRTPLTGLTDGIGEWLGTVTPGLLDRVLDYTTQKAMGLPSFLVALLMFVMATFFLTADYAALHARAARRLDGRSRRFLEQMRATALGAFGGYLKAQLLLTVGVFFILLAGFLVTRQPYGLLLAFGLALLDFIPLVGAGTVMVPWALVSLVTRDYSAAIRLMVIWGIIALFRRVMEPKFVGDQTGLSPVASLVSIYVGMKLAGVVGMILGPILLLIVRNLGEMGMFRNAARDLSAAAGDLAAILAAAPETSDPQSS